MRGLWMAAALTTIATPHLAPAQFFIGGSSFAVRSGFGFQYQNHHFGISGFAGRTFYSQYGYGGFYGLPSPWFSQTVIVPPPQVVVVPILIPARAEEVVEAVADPDRFVVIRPEPQPKALPARVEKKAKEVDLGIKPGELPLARAAGKPRVEADRQVEQGREAFGNGAHGRALEHFRRATVLAPEDASAWFMLAQAQFAAGKYDEADASIRAGMKLKPDWPDFRFKSRELYRLNPAAYDRHLGNLRESLAAEPNDPRLLFVLGVQLWFDAKREEARPLFERAAKITSDRSAIDPFLKR